VKPAVIRLESVPSASLAAPVLPPLIGQQLVGAGKLSEQDIWKIVSVQDSSKARFGEIAVKLGLVTDADIKEMLARQYAYQSSAAATDAFHPDLVAAADPTAARSEAYRTARSELQLRWLSAKNKVLAVTEARPGQGASVLAANLAVVFAQNGGRVLIIDANLRSPHQDTLFRMQTRLGFSAYLAGRCDLNAAILSVPRFDNLFLMPSGPVPPNPLELLGRRMFANLIERVRTDFDIVIVDTPAMLDSADARVISHLTGACILAVRRDVTRVADANKVRSTLAPTGATLVGAVLSA
jgi:protein-tyrosine kinase